MTNKPNNIPTPVAGRRGRLPPVRVELWWDGYQPAKVHPPDGGHENWWQRLNNALGTGSSDFANASMFQDIGCGSHAFWRHFGTRHECRARDDRSRSAEGRNRGRTRRPDGMHAHSRHRSSSQAIRATLSDGTDGRTDRKLRDRKRCEPLDQK